MSIKIKNDWTLSVLIGSLRLLAAAVAIQSAIMLSFGVYYFYGVVVLPKIQQQSVAVEVERAAYLKAVDDGLYLPRGIRSGDISSK
ncbi:hypothetical protein [Vibrio parahaemolyticus]|uniref:hypothetical protein n=1 Tax=Vibrio parahaemolyticus TaxID=670 RepID=UPI003D812E50